MTGIPPSTFWHGSRHDFEQFSTSAIGSGEGGSKHGWGIYFSSDRGRAEFFAELDGTSGLIYEVELSSGVHLDWQQPLSEQPAAAAALLAALPLEHSWTPSISLAAQLDVLIKAGWRGIDGYKHLAALLGTDGHPDKRAASLALLAHGVSGIAYLGQDDWDGVGTASYVAFEPASLRIVSKTSIAEGVVLWHGSSEPAETLVVEGLQPGRHGAVFLTDNPELALEYAQTDQERTGNDIITLVSVRVSDLDKAKLAGDLDHTLADDWQESLAETDQCMYLGSIPGSVLRVEAQRVEPSVSAPRL